MKRFKRVLLDFGHGGIKDGEYMTAGKRSPLFKDYTQVFEGVINREIGRYLTDLLDRYSIPYVVVSDQQDDTPLSERVSRANEYKDDSFLISLHSNAGGGRGTEFFTYFGQSYSDVIAELLADKYKFVFPDECLRTDTTDGDSDKEASFYLLKNTAMPAILIESFFMDNEDECKRMLMSIANKKKIADYIFLVIAELVETRSAYAYER